MCYIFNKNKLIKTGRLGEIFMASADFIKALIKAHINGDDSKFRQTALQIASKEASTGHAKLSKEIRELVDNVSPILGQQIGRIPPEIRTPTHKANNTELLHACYPRERLSEMVLSADTKASIERVIDEWRNHQLLESHGLQKRIKVLFVGPPGCGKTLSSRVFAAELGLPLFVVKLDSLISRYLGETAVHLRSIFNTMSASPGVYLFDEFDSIGTTRGDQRDVGEIRRVLSSFLVLLEGFDGNSLVIAATNYEQVLDNALFRRFDDIINFPMPDAENAQRLLKLKLQGVPKGDLDWGIISMETMGMSYAEITKAIMEALKTTVLSKGEKLTQLVLVEALKHRKAMTCKEL